MYLEYDGSAQIPQKKLCIAYHNFRPISPQKLDSNMESNQGYQKTQKIPAVLNTYPSLRRGKQELKVRVLQYSRSPRTLDIREYLETAEFNGFSKKGISITLEQFQLLLEHKDDIIKALSEGANNVGTGS